MKKQQFPTPITWELALQKKPLVIRQITVGILALQGDFLEHQQTLERLGVTTVLVKLPNDLELIQGLIMPGGESTTMANLLDVFALREPLKKKIIGGLPVWGTCAGMILLAKKLVQEKPIPLGVMDITVNRNAFGRQLDSFEVDIQLKPFDNMLHATFIRAPLVTQLGPAVEVLGKLNDGTIVAVRQHNMLGTSFHPELTSDTRFHEYFLSLIQ